MLPLSVRQYIRTYVRTYVCPTTSALLVQYFWSEFYETWSHCLVPCHDVFFKFDNGPYRTMPSVVMALCLWKFTIWNNVRSLSRIFFFRILWNLVTLFSTMMSSSSSIMVNIWLQSFKTFNLAKKPLIAFILINKPLNFTSSVWT